MPDLIGRITVPEVAASGTFPIASDYPHGRAIEPVRQIHRFGSANAKIEQRFLVGPGTNTYRVKRDGMSWVERDSLLTFWEARQGPYQPFGYDVPPDAHGGATTPITARFMDQVLSFDHLAAAIADVGIVLAEVPTVFPEYTTAAIVERKPSGGLEAGLLSQDVEVIPLMRIRVKEAAVPDIFLSNRRLTVDGQLYQARLLRWEGISQQIGGAPDDAQFVFGNADRVMQAVANDTNLDKAWIEFSVLHVETLIQLDLWAGDLNGWRRNGLTEFAVTAWDPAADINAIYPKRSITRNCWKAFNDGNACPAAGSGGSNLGDPCDKGFDTARGCVYHTMEDFYGGVEAQPQLAHIKDNSQGRWGFGRPRIPVSSIQSESVYGQALRQIYTDGVEINVNCQIVSGREESDFYAALGIVGKGEIGAYATPVFPAGELAGDPKHRLDTQPWHGFKDGGYLGLHANTFEPSLGPDPNEQPFAIDYDPLSERRAAGVAFLFIRRTDEPGIQLTRLSDHAMEATVSEGLSGYVWTGPGARSTAVLSNPIWIMVNAFLEMRGLEFATAAAQEEAIDVQACVDAADICDISVSKIIGSGSVLQFIATGAIEQRQPIRAWLQDILNNCLGDFSFRFGKLAPVIRVNSSAEEAFTVGNVIWNSYDDEFARPEFDHIIGHFADQDLKFSGNHVDLWDETHALLNSGTGEPIKHTKEITYSLSSTKDQVARLITPRLREELGGITEAEWKRRRRWSVQTTVLALNVEPGMVISYTDGEFSSAAGETNVGTGAMSAVTFSGPAAPGDHRIVITAASPDAGDFDVFDPDDVLIGSGTVGVEFEGGGLRFTLADGAVDFAVDDEFTVTMTENGAPGGTIEGRVLAWRLNQDWSISLECISTTDSMYDLTAGPKPDDVEPDAVPEETTGVPPAPTNVLVVLQDGHFRADDIEFPEYEGPTRQVTSIRWALFHVDELSAHLTLLSANIDASQTSFDLDDAGIVGGFNWLQIGGEVMFVPEDMVGNTVTVLRGEKGSTAGAHTAGDKVWLVTLTHRFDYFAVGTWTGLPASGGENFVAVHELLSQKLVAYEWIAYNARGGSVQTTTGTSSLFGTGIRLLSGLDTELTVPGKQSAVADDVAPGGSKATFNSSIGWIEARALTAPAGGDLTFRIRIAGVEWGLVTIEDGETVSDRLFGINMSTGDLKAPWLIDEVLTVDRTVGNAAAADVVILVKH